MMVRFAPRRETVRLTRNFGSLTVRASHSLPFPCISRHGARAVVGTVVNKYGEQTCLVLCGHREKLIVTRRRRFKGEGGYSQGPPNLKLLYNSSTPTVLWYSSEHFSGFPYNLRAPYHLASLLRKRPRVDSHR